jgi:sensor domain CHASE-containing protein
MSTELILTSFGLLVAIAAIVVSVWAILDVRAQVKELIRLERKRVFTKVRNDMVWLFINPTERAHTPEIAKGLEEFAVLSQALDPKQTADLTNHAMNNEALTFAEKLVKNGYATWKDGWNMEELKKTLHNWQTAINDVRMTNILGEEQKRKSLL